MVGGSALVRMGHRELRGRRLTTVVGFRLAVNDTLQRAHVSRLTRTAQVPAHLRHQ